MPEVAPDTIVPEKRRTSDSDDPHVGWTSQQLLADDPVAFPGLEYNPNTRFHPDELPEEGAAEAIGLEAHKISDVLIDPEHKTQSPMAEVVREEERKEGRRARAAREKAEAEEGTGTVQDAAREAAEA